MKFRVKLDLGLKKINFGVMKNNGDVIMEYIDSVLIFYKLKHNFYKLYFIFDSAKCHTTPKVFNHLEKNNIEAII